MTIEGAIATNEPLSGDIEISVRASLLVVALCWIGIFTEGYDVGVLGAILPALATDASWKLTSIELGALGSYTLFGMLVGGILSGTLSDLHGRKPLFIGCFTSSPSSPSARSSRPSRRRRPGSASAAL